MPPATGNYTEPVKFTETNLYGCGSDDEDDVYTVAEFMERVKNRSFIDYDGFGSPVRDGKSDETIWVKPSKAVEQIPADATHIVWFNR